MPARVAITRDAEDIGVAIETGLGSLEVEEIVRGRVVAVKPNDTWASDTDISGVTQADTLRAVLRHRESRCPCRRRGGRSPAGVQPASGTAPVGGRMGLGETDLEAMDFPALSLKEAIGAFTQAVYGERLTFEHE